ncbi:MAG: hypothetical protein IKU08_02375 [Clostridia bacterium]|nr:hypothetical protein [Clostridia bacterium]
MNKLLELSDFIEGIFDLYGMNKNNFFIEYDDETNEFVEVPLFVGIEDYDEITLKQLCVYLGMSENEILSKDSSAVKRMWNKYPFFQLFNEYNERWYWFSRFKNEMPSPKEKLLNILFEEQAPIIGVKRYNYKDVTTRMISQLKEIDKIIPGTYHNNAEITNLQIDTEVFFSFPDCAKMLHSFVEMVDRTKELFFKAIENDLNTEEINELNFLTSWLDAVDIMDTSTHITYDNIKTYRKVYKEENLTDFFSYVKIRNFVIAGPWRCQEFFDDMTLVQEFVNIFPQSKKEMHRFAMEVTKFACHFVWSDAKPITNSPEDEAMLSGFNALIGEKDIPIDEQAQELTLIYVDKTSEEMFDWSFYAERLNAATSPQSKGGLKLPVRELEPYNYPDAIYRIEARIEARGGKH